MSIEVSVILPVFNREPMVEAAVRSIAAQSYRPLEIVVVDDGSADRSAEVARSASDLVRVERIPHAGVACARNHGVRSARGEYMAFLDSDDHWPVDWLGGAVERMQADPSLDLLQGSTEIIRTESAGDHRPRFVQDGAHIYRELLGSFLVRKRVFETVGLFDETLEASEDVDWVARTREAGCKEERIDARVLEYRVHAGNMTNDVAMTKRTMAQMLKKRLDRRREAARG